MRKEKLWIFLTDNGKYRCRWEDPSGSVTSAAGTFAEAMAEFKWHIRHSAWFATRGKYHNDLYMRE